MGLLSFLKGNKENVEEYLPYNLKIGSSLEFDPILFSKLGSDSKFAYKNTVNVVKKIGIYDVNNTKYANIYLESVGNKKSYVQIGLKNSDIIECRLFLQYEEISQKEKSEWKKLIGNHSEQGVLGKDSYVIAEQPLEKIKELLIAITKGSYPDFRKFGKFDFALSENIFKTNIMKVISNSTGISYDEVIKNFTDRLQDEKWLSEISIDEGEEIFILNEDLMNYLTQTVYKNELPSMKFLDIDEKIYGNNSFFKPDYTLKKRFSIYSRKIRGEFYKKEFLELSFIKNEKTALLSIDIGIDIPTSQLNKIELI